MLQGIETPEGNQLAAIDGRMMDEIKSKIDFLSKELFELKKALQIEPNLIWRRRLRRQIERTEFELRWLRYQEEHITKSIIERR